MVQPFRPWCVTVLLMDMGLVAAVSPALQRAAVVAVLSWLAADGAESAARFGLYDAAYPFAMKRPVPAVCNCGVPPCTQPVE